MLIALAAYSSTASDAPAGTSETVGTTGESVSATEPPAEAITNVTSSMSEQSKRFMIGDLDMLTEIFADSRYPNMAGIFAGTAKGKIWTLGDKMPVLAVAKSYCVGGCGLAGAIPNGMENEARPFFEVIFDALRADGDDSFEFSAEDERLYAIVSRETV